MAAGTLLKSAIEEAQKRRRTKAPVSGRRSLSSDKNLGRILRKTILTAEDQRTGATRRRRKTILTRDDLIGTQTRSLLKTLLGS